MTPETRFHSLVVGCTVAIMFIVLSAVIPLLESIHLPLGIKISLGPAIAFLTSAATYQTVTKIFIALLRHSPWLKQKILGPFYVEGTWAGYLIDTDRKLYYVIEHFEQELTSLVIKGGAYTATGELVWRWQADATNINGQSGTLTYAFTCDPLDDGTVHQGLAVFDFKRQRSTAPPYAIEGYAADVLNGRRMPSNEKKASSLFLEDGEALEIAKSFARAKRNLEGQNSASVGRESSKEEKMPIDWREHIVSTPDVLRGKPRIKGTRIPVSLILGYLAAGHTAEEIMAELSDLSKEQIAACLDYARALAEFEVAV
jgi:uncharacterized protein (DUF433 family)